MVTAAEAFNRLRERAESIKNDSAQTFPEAASAEDYVRQGDLYITRLDRLPYGASEIPYANQLAPGTSRGSRHCLSHDRVVMYQIKDHGPLDGPILRVAEPVTITHPEHGDWILGKGIYQITYQRAFAEELRAVLD